MTIARVPVGEPAGRFGQADWEKRLPPLTRNGLAIFALAAAMMTAPCAHAVYLDPDGRGQALIFPYYTVQSASGNPFNTYISVVNRTFDAKVIRVRFREGRNGREVAGFNLYLSGGDAWAAAIVPSESGTRLVTVDQSCVNGPFVVGGGSRPTRTYDFTNAGYTGAADDGLGAGLDRTREGYVEMIEMATLRGASLANVSLPPLDASATTPSNCPAVQGASVPLETAAPTGGLSGTLTLINVAKGMDFTVNAVALAELTTQSFYRDVGDPYPDFNSSEVTPVSQFLAGGKSYRAIWATGVEAVASTITAESIGNETILDAGTHSGTDWIITFPLRRFLPQYSSPPTTYPPAPNSGVGVKFYWDPRDGRGVALATCDVPGFFQCQIDGRRWYEMVPFVPWAATVMSFSRGTASAAPVPFSTALGSTNAVMMTLPTTAENGAGSMSFEFSYVHVFKGTSMRVSDGAVKSESNYIRGEPVVGFMVRTFENGQLTCGSAVCQGNYGGAFPHKSIRLLR